MTQISEIHEGNGDSIKIGTVGTIGSLMSQELNSMNSTQVASSYQKKNLTTPLSVSSADASKTTQPTKILANEASSSNNHNAHHLSTAQKPRQKPLKNGQRAPIPTNEVQTDKKARRNKNSKKGHTYIVEVVDIKCNNPMSSRLKKLGFTKLSETIEMEKLFRADSGREEPFGLPLYTVCTTRIRTVLPVRSPHRIISRRDEC